MDKVGRQVRGQIRQVPRPKLFPTQDSLVFHFQLLHDGHLPYWTGDYDLNENSEERLRQVLKGRGFGRYGKGSRGRIRMETGLDPSSFFLFLAFGIFLGRYILFGSFQ